MARIEPRAMPDGSRHPMDRWIASERQVNGLKRLLTEDEQAAIHAEWAANSRESQIDELEQEADRRLAETDSELADLTARAVADPLRRPALQRLIDYRDALKARKAAIRSEMDGIPIPAWGPGEDGTGTKTDYDPSWPVRS